MAESDALPGSLANVADLEDLVSELHERVDERHWSPARIWPRGPPGSDLGTGVPRWAAAGLRGARGPPHRRPRSCWSGRAAPPARCPGSRSSAACEGRVKICPERGWTWSRSPSAAGSGRPRKGLSRRDRSPVRMKPALAGRRPTYLVRPRGPLHARRRRCPRRTLCRPTSPIIWRDPWPPATWRGAARRQQQPGPAGLLLRRPVARDRSRPAHPGPDRHRHRRPAERAEAGRRHRSRTAQPVQDRPPDDRKPRTQPAASSWNCCTWASRESTPCGAASRRWTIPAWPSSTSASSRLPRAGTARHCGRTAADRRCPRPGT